MLSRAVYMGIVIAPKSWNSSESGVIILFFEEFNGKNFGFVNWIYYFQRNLKDFKDENNSRTKFFKKKIHANCNNKKREYKITAKWKIEYYHGDPLQRFGNKVCVRIIPVLHFGHCSTLKPVILRSKSCQRSLISRLLSRAERKPSNKWHRAIRSLR